MLSIFFKITQFLKLKIKGIASLTGWKLSFSDLGYFDVQFDILQYKVDCELKCK